MTDDYDVIFCIAVSISAQPGVKGWFSDNRHHVLYAVMGLVIVILFVIILWLLHDNRKYRKSGATVAKKNKNKSSIDKEVV
ncbi:Hypothetical predicted protein [Paramuricea clavata]|uniref:Uncharacterized protein n=1 Tax=Paramuricea clavata TaxID=317549 RepID=A0A7D9K9P9_PARCT|nr:Hypothetical predicted protein [Paramuricea clavata]